MATYYWVGGAGTWDTTSTANWSNASGGSSGFGPPTSADDVIFDAASNVGTGAFTVTVSNAVCRDFSTGGAGGALDGAMTLAMGTSTLFVHGSFTLPATNFSFTASAGAQVRFVSTVAGNTVTTNGVTFATVAVIFDGVGGEWTLGSAFTLTSAGIDVRNGTFDTSGSNYSVSANTLGSTGTGAATIKLNGSSVTVSASGGIIFSNNNLTFNAGTSTITASGANSAITSTGHTFNNVSFTSPGAGSITISGVNTFNNLTFTSRSATGIKTLVFTANQTVNGTLTFGAANTAIRRILAYGTASTGAGVGTPITLTVATLATLADVDFRDITAAGASAPWSGTRIGDGGGNSNITVTAGATKYWNLAAGGNWSATAWATGSGGAVDVNNFPLAQDTVVIENTGLNTSATITIDQNWWIPNIGASTRTNAFTLAGTSSPQIYKEFNIPSVATVTASGVWYFAGRSTTQNITTNGVSVALEVNCMGTTGNTVKFVDAFTTTNAVTLQQGTLDLNNNTITARNLSSTNSNTRTLAFGTGNFTLTGNSLTVVGLGTVTNLTITGTPVINATYSGSTGTRTIGLGALGEASAISVNVSAGSDTVSFATTSGSYKNIIMTGFSGVMSFANSLNIFGNLTLSATQTVNSGTQTVGFSATSGTQTITSNGVTFDRNVNISAPGATVQLADALTMGSGRTLTLTAGTFTTTASNYNVTAGSFNSNNANVRTLSLNGSTVTINGELWNIADSTNLTLNPGTSTINMTSADAKFFAGGSKTYGSLNQGGAGDLTITGANTFADISNTVQPAKIIFPAGVKTIVNALSVSGTSGNLISLESSSSDAALIEYQP